MDTITVTDTHRHKSEAINLNGAQRRFITYVRTLQFMKTRLKGIDESEAVYIYQKFIEQHFFIHPQYDRKSNLQGLIDAGELEVKQIKSPFTGHKMYVYRALKSGGIDLYLYRELYQPNTTNYGDNTIRMRNYLKRVSLPEGAQSTPYFDVFLKHKNDLIELFFTVDDFAQRVHTPVTNLHRHLRPTLLIDDSPTVGLDVKTMQPLILSKVLMDRIGNNEYTNWINAGQDIYVMLQKASGLDTRDQGKKRFFEIVFAPANKELSGLFGSAQWITWINHYKRTQEHKNPHTQYKPYSNLAWLLQTTEVLIMRKVWRELNNHNIPFLSVHDEVIVKQSDRHQAERIFREVLDQEFSYYQLNVKQPGTNT